MALQADSAAREVCALGNWKVTNQQLHKILYLLQMLHLGRRGGERLIEASFEAWDFGPVIPDLYRRCAMFGSTPIHNMFYGVVPVHDPENAAFLKQAGAALVALSPPALVAVTRRDGGAWAQCYAPGRRWTVIPDADILAEYREQVRAEQ